MMARAAKAAKSKTMRLDFTDVETQVTVPEGEYHCIVKVPPTKEEGDEYPYFEWKLAIKDGKYKGKTLYTNTSTSPQSLWAFKRHLEALGYEDLDGEFDFDPADAVDRELGVVVEHDIYKGRTKSKITDVFPIEGEETGATEKEPEEAAAGELPGKDEIMEMGKADLRKLVEEHELDVELEGSTTAQRRQVLKAIEDKPAAKPGKKDKPAAKGKGKKKKVSSETVNGMTAEELEELIETHELEVDLDEHGTMRRKRSAVIDKLEEAELLEDE